MKKVIVLAGLVLFLAFGVDAFAEGGSGKMSSMAGKEKMEKGAMRHEMNMMDKDKMGKGMMSHKMKMMGTIKEMQGMITEMIEAIKGSKAIKGDRVMIEKMDVLIARGKKMAKKTDAMIKKCSMMDKEDKGDKETSSEAPSGHESHH